MQILDEEEKIGIDNRTLAPKMSRFLNYTLDNIAFLIFQLILDPILQDFVGEVSLLQSALISLVTLMLLYTLFEYHTGKTPGKFLTRTSVVTATGERPTFTNLLGRSLARFIPFDTFSFLLLERGWHDSLSGTYVVMDNPES